jgi:hypothetical protein
MINNTNGTKSKKDALEDRKLYLANLIKLISSSYKVMTRCERLSIAAINSEVKRIDAMLQ